LRRTMLRGLTLILSIGLVSTAMLCWIAGPPFGLSLSIYWGSLIATIPAACWLLWSVASPCSRWPRWTAGRFELAWGSLLVVDLLTMGWPLVDTRPQAPLYEPPSCIRFLIDRGSDHVRVLDREVPEHGERSALGLAIPLIDRL